MTFKYIIPTTTTTTKSKSTYLQGLRVFSQSLPSNRHCGLLHISSQWPFINTSQQLIGAVQFLHGLMPSEQSLPSNWHANVLHSSSHLWLPDLALQLLIKHFFLSRSSSLSIVIKGGFYTQIITCKFICRLILVTAGSNTWRCRLLQIITCKLINSRIIHTIYTIEI